MTMKEIVTNNVQSAGCDIIVNANNELAWYTLNSEYFMKCTFNNNGELIHKLTLEVQTNKVVSQW